MARETSHLIDEYLDLCERGLEPDVEALVAEAGEAGPELRARIETLRSLRELGALVDEHGEPLEIPERLAQFRLLHPLGQGGVARVYLAQDEQLGRTVAVKVLSVSSLSPQELGAVTREGRALATLEDPGIVRVHEIDVFEGLPYVVMEYVDGPSLHAVLQGLRALARDGDTEGLTPADLRAARELSPWKARCRLIARVARALHTCHGRGVVHRDVKPGNILLNGQHQPKLADFGLAHMDSPDDSRGHTQALVGTPGYVAPEQVDQQRTGSSPQSDQFSLGTVLYELLTLRHPFLRDSRAATMTAISEARPARPRQVEPALPKDLERIVLHCLERDPNGRYPDLATLAADLESVADDRPIGLRPPSPLRRLQLFARRHRRPLARIAGSLLVVALLAGAGGLWSLHSKRSAWSDAALATRHGLAECNSASAIVRAFQDAERQRAGSLPLTRAALHVCFPPLGPDPEETLELCSERLHELLTEARKAPRTLNLGEEVIVNFREALELDRRLCPDSPHNAVDRDRGYVTFKPPEPGERALLFRMTGSPAGEGRLVETNVPVGPLAESGGTLRLDPGLYRLEYRKEGHGDSARMREFEVRPDTPLREIGCLPLAPGIAGERFRVLDDAGRVLCELSAELITWKELREKLPERSAFLKRIVAGDQSWEELDGLPANPTWVEAFEYAALVGARLPQFHELERAARQGLQGEEDGQEWTATPLGDRDRFYFRYGHDSPKFYRRAGVVKPIGFRLAFPAR